MTPRLRTNAAIDARAQALFGKYLDLTNEAVTVEPLRQILTALERGQPITPDLRRAARDALAEADTAAAVRRRASNIVDIRSRIRG